MKEELTTKMHSEFIVSEDTDLKHRVWALLSEAERRGVEAKVLMAGYGLTVDQVERYRPGYLRLNR